MELLTYLSSLSIPNLFSRMPAAAAQGSGGGVQALRVQVFGKALAGHFLEPPHKLAGAAPAGCRCVGHVQHARVLLVHLLYHGFQSSGVGGIGRGQVAAAAHQRR